MNTARATPAGAPGRTLRKVPRSGAIASGAPRAAGAAEPSVGASGFQVMTATPLHFPGEEPAAEPAHGMNGRTPARWEHFRHGADIGVRGIGLSPGSAFEQAALALTAVATAPEAVAPAEEVRIETRAPDRELLLPEWLNALVHEMATRGMLFGRFDVQIRNRRLAATAWGEPVDLLRHRPAATVKGATYTGVKVRRRDDGFWVAECIVDV